MAIHGSLHPSRMAETPTIFEWAGGTEAFGHWLNHFYDLVEEEGTLAPLFGRTVGEAPGGPR